MPVRKDGEVKSTKASKKDAMRAALNNDVEVEQVVKLKKPSPAKKITKPKTTPKTKSGKSSNPDYQQTTVYIRKSTLISVKMSLLQESKDLSELIEELLEKHVSKT